MTGRGSGFRREVCVFVAASDSAVVLYGRGGGNGGNDGGECFAGGKTE